MKARLIQTDFWNDESIQDMSLEAQHLYIFLLTCPHINMCGIFKLSRKQIMLMASLTSDQVDAAMAELSTGNKVQFHDGWIFVVNALEKNTYLKSPKTRKSCEKEMAEIPEEVKNYFFSISGKTMETAKTQETSTPQGTTATSSQNQEKPTDTVSIQYPAKTANADSVSIEYPQNKQNGDTLSIQYAYPYNNIHNNNIKRGVGEKYSIDTVSPQQLSLPEMGVESKSYPTLGCIQDEEIRAVAREFSVPVSFVKDKFEDLKLSCGAKRKSYENYLDALKIFVKNDKHYNDHKITPAPEMTHEDKIPATLEQQRAARETLPPALKAKLDHNHPLGGDK